MDAWAVHVASSISRLHLGRPLGNLQKVTVRTDRAAEGVVVGAEARAHEAFQALLGSLGLHGPYLALQGFPDPAAKQAAHL